MHEWITIAIMLACAVGSAVCAIVCGAFYWGKDKQEQGRREQAAVTHAELRNHCSLEHSMRDKILAEHYVAFEARLTRMENSVSHIAGKIDDNVLSLIQRVAVLEERVNSLSREREQD